MAIDTVFNGEMRPVFAAEPPEVLRRLKSKQHPDTWEKVCVGETGRVITIPEYLYSEKYQDVQRIIKDVVSKSRLTMYERNPARLNVHIERTALRIIELILRDR